MTLRKRALDLARSSVGLSAAPSKLEPFGLLMGRGESAQVRKDMATWRNPMTGQSVSTCALVDRGICNECGVDEPLVRPKYVAGTAFTTIEVIADKRRAKRKPSSGSLPSPGDIVAVGALTPDGHMFMVESLQKNLDGTVTLFSIDGGQVSKAKATAPDDPGGVQMIARKRRTWTPDGRGGWLDKAVIVEPAGYDSYTARAVSWWVDLDALEAGGPMLDPSSEHRGSGTPQSAPTPAQGAPQAAPGASLTPTIRRGDRGPVVARWQPFVDAKVDGDFGPVTEDLTKVFQRKYGLPATGIVDAAAWAVALAKKTDPSGVPVQILEGIDVSSIQGVIDWDRVAAAGIRFAYIRTVIGLDTRDAMRAINAARARKAGIEIGLYGVCYPRHGRAQDAEKQGAQLAADHKASGATLRPMIDFESLKDVPDATPIEWSNALTAYIAGLGADGLDPILYTYPSFWRSLGDVFSASRWAHYPLWIAHYTKAAQPDVPPPWSRALVWQYAASAPGFEGRVDGVPGLVDRNRLFGSLDDMRVQR